MQEKQIKRRLWVRRLLKWHTYLLVISFGLYFLLALFDPGLLSYDLRNKYRAFADDLTVTARVLGAPVKPVVSATADCDESTGTLSVLLDWSDDPNTSTYDIARDGSPLISGLSASQYTDATGLSLGTTYQYVVTANGPMSPGTASSDPVDVATPAECTITLPAPTVDVVSFSGKNVLGENGRIEVSNKKPLFTGVANVPNAIVHILVESNPIYTATFSANANGYWEWRQPSSLSLGEHTFTVTIEDPNDSTRTATDILYFKIVGRSDTNEKKTSSAISKIGQKAAEDLLEKHSEQARLFNIDLSLKNKEGMVLQGEDALTRLFIHQVSKEHNNEYINVRYSVRDKKNNEVFFFTKKTFIYEGGIIEERIPIPLYWSVGEYSLSVELFFSDITLAREVTFRVVELPLLQLSSGELFSFSDLIRNLSWIVLVLLIFFFFWLFLFIREYALFLQADNTIDEKQLKKAGYLDK